MLAKIQHYFFECILSNFEKKGMDTSALIEMYCNEIRSKFLSNRKMGYERKVAYSIKRVKELNDKYGASISDKFILKVLDLHHPPLLEPDDEQIA